MIAAETEIIARAVIRSGGRVLLARSVGGSWWFLPGGHVEPGENIEAALLRELVEELGTEARIDRPLAVVETSYRSDDGPHHELNHVFEVTLAVDEPESRESHLEFRWLPPDELAAADLRPDSIKQLLL